MMCDKPIIPLNYNTREGDLLIASNGPLYFTNFKYIKLMCVVLFAW